PVLSLPPSLPVLLPFPTRRSSDLLDAPCQQTCPVGAITWLENQAVQIHRDRCIGCSQCASECPFGVIDMYEPFSVHDAPSSKKGDRKSTRLNSSHQIISYAVFCLK